MELKGIGKESLQKSICLALSSQPFLLLLVLRLIEEILWRFYQKEEETALNVRCRGEEPVGVKFSSNSYSSIPKHKPPLDTYNPVLLYPTHDPRIFHDIK